MRSLLRLRGVGMCGWCVCVFTCARVCEPSGEGLLGILIHFHCARDPGRQLVPCLLAPTAEVGISVLVHYVSF